MASAEPGREKNRCVRVGKYRVIAHLATGGMGAVYKAQDEELGRIVALKILVRDLAIKPERVDRFRKEARHAARLNHENIVTIYEFGEFEDLQYLALEYVDGVDLLHYIGERGRLEPTEACEILAQAATALEHSFEQGIIHRDVKPSNLLVTRRRGQLLVKLTDLGIAREVENESNRMTGAGLIVGTIDYLAPEQARDSAKADIRSDIYSLGCTLYEMLSGHPPFKGSVTELVYKHAEEMPEPIRSVNPAVPAGLSFILNKMMAKKPVDRYQTPTELLLDLRRIGTLGTESPKAEIQTDKAAGAAKGLQEAIRRRTQPEPRQCRGTDEQTSIDRDTAQIPNPSPKQYRIAVGLFEKASEAIGKDNFDYGIPLLLNCCALDPANLKYRQLLRQAGEANGERRTHAKVSTTVVDWVLKARVKAALKTHSYAKALELSEQILIHSPGDYTAQLDAAQAARASGLLNSSVWMFERLHKQYPKAAEVSRPLAHLYEERKDYGKSIAVWESIAKADPLDSEARTKIQTLSAHQTIRRGGYEELLEWPGGKK
jgi:serine/threonine protein kinase